MNVTIVDKYSAGLNPKALCAEHSNKWENDCRNCTRAQSQRDPTWHNSGPLPVALEHHYDDDAHFVQYHLEGQDMCPRLSKRSLTWLAEQDMHVRMGAMAFDVDGPNHEASPEWRQAERKKIGTMVRAGNPVAWYDTNGGYRLVWSLPEPLSVDVWVQRRAALAIMLREYGIEPDTGAADWTRLFRLPFVHRDGENTWEDPALRSASLMAPPPPPKTGATVHTFQGISQASIPVAVREKVGVRSGGRNTALTRMAGQWRRMGFEPLQILALLQEWNARKCDPPLPEDEVERIAESSSTWEAPAQQMAVEEEEKGGAGCEYASLDPLKSGSERELMGRLKDDLEANSFGAPLIFASGCLWRWRQTHWRALTEPVIRDLLGRYEGWPVIKGVDKDGNPRVSDLKIPHSKAKSVAAMLGDTLVAEEEQRQETGSDRASWFDEDAAVGIGFVNGFVDATGKLVPHHWTHRNTFRLPINYAPGRRPALFIDTLLKGCLRDHPDTDGAIQLIREWLGVALLGLSTTFQVALMLHGSGNNGKSTLLDIVGHLFNGRRSSITPQKLGEEQYIAKLHGVLLNVITECPSSELLVSEGTKAAISGDELTAKIVFREPFAFRPRAGHIFAANQLPPVRDMTDGFFRRFLVIGFNRKLKKSEVDRTLKQRILDTELEDIAAWLVQGGLQAVERGSFKVPDEVVLATKAWREDSNPVAVFLKDQWSELRGIKQMQFRQLFERFKPWAASANYRPIGLRTFGDRLRSCDDLVEVTRKSGGMQVVFKKHLAVA